MNWNKCKGVLKLFLCKTSIQSVCLGWAFALSDFFFPLRVNSNLTWVHCAGEKITVHALFITVHSTVHALKNIKNGSHGIIHTFKNYFATVLLVFSFQFQRQ